jgi:sugar phosphate isomerase/epimerase
MALPIALQLYSVREELKEDYEGTMQKLADMGYLGVEPAGYPGTTPEAAAKVFQRLNLQVPSVHSALPTGESRDRVLSELETLGCQTVVSGRGADRFATEDLIKGVCDEFNEAAEVAAEEGLQVGYHNHWWEYQEVADTGKIGYEIMLEHLSPNVFFQIDAYWVQTGGQDPATVVDILGNRVKTLHLKDGPCDRDQPMQALGQGEMNYGEILRAAQNVEWLIVELDRVAGDMLEAVAESVTYLTGSGLGEARS